MEEKRPPGVRQRVVAKALGDPDYRRRLLADPRSAVEAEAGRSLHPDVRVTVLEESPDQIYIVLPHVGSRQLTQAELEGIAGGRGHTHGVVGPTGMVIS